MGILGNLFKQKKTAIAQNVNQAIAKDVVEAVISGALLVAFADGSCDDDELTSLEGILAAEETFAPMAAEFPALIAKFAGKLSEGRFKMGKLVALRELGDLKSRPADAELVFACIECVADNGGVSDEERAVLKEIAAALGVAYRG